MRTTADLPDKLIICILLFGMMFFTTPANSGDKREPESSNKTNNALASNSGAKDITAPFMAQCMKRKSRAFCECTLKKYSDMMRSDAEKRLKKLEYSADTSRKRLLSDPALTESRIEAVCKLHESALEYKRKADLARDHGDSGLYKEYNAKKSELFTRKRELVSSYNADPQSASPLSVGYCETLHDINQIKKDQAEDDGILYPQVKRMLENYSVNVWHHIKGAGRSCPNKNKSRE